MKILRITEDIIRNKVVVYQYNTRTKNSLLLADDCTFNEFVKWYGLSYHYHYEYRQVTW